MNHTNNIVTNNSTPGFKYWGTLLQASVLMLNIYSLYQRRTHNREYERHLAHIKALQARQLELLRARGSVDDLKIKYQKYE